MQRQGDVGGRLLGVLPTFHRPVELAHTLGRLRDQSRLPDRLVIVDNAADPETEGVVGRHGSALPGLEYLPSPENLGFAGGVAAGMEHVLPGAEDDDWVVVFDDDDPPPDDGRIGDLERFAARMRGSDPRTAAVGGHGGRFDWRRGRIRRVPDADLKDAVPVDYVGGNSIPFFLVSAIRKVGPFSRAVFFGLSEVEYCLRLRQAGYSVYADGELWKASRASRGRMGLAGRPSYRLPRLDWRRYYTLRNVIHILRTHQHSGTAARVVLIQGLGKPLANVPLSPGLAWRHLRLNWMACRDGWAGRMGRRVEPHPWGRRESKPELQPR